ncbi:MAG: hypothetical protein U0798_17610 [Gemmataceae bacterium]
MSASESSSCKVVCPACWHSCGRKRRSSVNRWHALPRLPLRGRTARSDGGNEVGVIAFGVGSIASRAR